MHSRKFPTFDDAIAYIQEAGEVKFHGRIGERYEWCTYTLTIGNRVYHCNIHNNGLLEVVHERYRRD